MTTIRLKFRPSSVADREGTLYYQVTHLRKVIMISSGCHIYPHEWDARRAAIRTADSTGSGSEREAQLRLCKARTNRMMERMRKTAAEKERNGHGCSTEELQEALLSITPCESVFDYIRSQTAKKTRMGCYGTARTYANALQSFVRFRKAVDLGFDDMSSGMIEEYEAWMLHKGLKRNSAVCYMRTLRTLYRQAVTDGQAEDRDIFRKVHMTIGKTRKRAVSADLIRAIQRLDLSRKPALGFARDIFMFSFYTRGMSFVDIAHLRKSDLHNGCLTYNRRKTFQCITIQWERPMQTISDRYAGLTRDRPYLFPIITGEEQDDRSAYEQTLQRINRSLKRIGGMLGLQVPLTTYVARHSWASIARDMGVPLSVISEGLGHDSDKTTQIYLASLDTAMVNKANKMIINRIAARR